MKQFLLSLVLLGLPYWLPADEAYAFGDEGCAQAIVVKQVGSGSDNEPKVFSVTSASGGEPQVITLTGNAGDEPKSFTFTTGGAASSRGWLGVSLDLVPDSLASQLDVDGQGVLVQNVVKDSPADRAGIQVHDVILSLNGNTVKGIEGLTELMSTFKPGTRVAVVLLQGGQKRTVTVELGSRADVGAMTWKFDAEPNQRIEERIRTHGKIMGKGPGGEWFMKDLGNLGDLKFLPEQLRVMIPKDGNRSTQVFTHEGKTTVRVKVEDDGSTITVTQDDDGEIEVSRTDKDGNKSEATYANEDELKSGDPDAYELFSNNGKGMVFIQGGDGDGDSDGNFDFDFDIDMDHDLGEWREKLEEGIKDAQEAIDRAHEEFEAAHRQMAEKMQSLHVPWAKSPDGRSDAGQPAPLHHGAMLRHLGGRPTNSFQVLSDGKIEVRIRKGDSEIVRTFQSEADLQKRDPKLYQKYTDLNNAEE
ncbi:MAG: PDZ domain-containing protein [Planctomycetota bacterium]